MFVHIKKTGIYNFIKHSNKNSLLWKSFVGEVIKVSENNSLYAYSDFSKLDLVCNEIKDWEEVYVDLLIVDSKSYQNRFQVATIFENDEIILKINCGDIFNILTNYIRKSKIDKIINFV